MAAIPALPPSPGAAKVPPTSMGNAPSPRETDRPPAPASNQFLQRDRLRKLLQVARGHHRDRKSTRLNSSHTVISYAVFCLKKKITLYRPSSSTFRRQNLRRISAQRIDHL